MAGCSASPALGEQCFQQVRVNPPLATHALTNLKPPHSRGFAQFRMHCKVTPARCARIVRAGDVRGISARDVVEKSRPAALPTRCGAFFFSDLVIVTTLIAGVAMVIGQNPIGWFDTRTKSPLASVPTFRMV